MKNGCEVLRKTKEFEIYKIGSKVYQFYYKTSELKEVKRKIGWLI